MRLILLWTNLNLVSVLSFQLLKVTRLTTAADIVIILWKEKGKETVNKLLFTNELIKYKFSISSIFYFWCCFFSRYAVVRGENEPRTCIFTLNSIGNTAYLIGELIELLIVYKLYCLTNFWTYLCAEILEHLKNRVGPNLIPYLII